jgi:hypothetical protein
MIAEADAPGIQEHFCYLVPLPLAEARRGH